MSVSLLDPILQETIKKDSKLLTKTKVPIITVSASSREDVKAFYGYPDDNLLPDVVFSRAHYSMSVGIAVEAWGKEIHPKKAWLVDPTNYVSSKEWKKIKLTEFIGKTLARRPFLKKIKDFIDQFLRSKLPIIDSITPPLLELTRHINRPILSMHVAAGNVLIEHGRKVVQVITDPHVREDYLKHADCKNMYYCVFDEKTKTDFLEKAALLNKRVKPDHIIITGPPIDPRIIAARKNKVAWRSGPLRLCIATGGLGTNKSEIRKLIRQLMPELRKHEPRFKIMLYGGTQSDICDMVRKIAKEERVKVGHYSDEKTNLSLVYHPQIVDANEMLIKHIFPNVDGFLTKPSGDMAYDAVAAGCFLLTLREWGIWEENIEDVFEQKNIAREAQSDDIVTQLETLMEARGKADSWIETAMQHALQIDPLFLNGSKQILKAYNKIAKGSTKAKEMIHKEG